MAYFIPSYIQKRLLRYALSRLELLDTDDLDLEKLDIAWGRRSSVELKDVGLRKNKLSSLLRLTELAELEVANILRLRATVPADLYTSPIVVEIDGVEVRARLLNDNEREQKPKSSSRQRSSRQDSKKVKPQRAPASHLKNRHVDLFEPESDDGNDILPTTHDLAASFLAEEPAEERKQLEAALSSQSVDLKQSTSSMDDDNDGSEYGTGFGITVPAFLANFLTSIADRLQVVVKNVKVSLDLDLEIFRDENSDANREPISAPTTVVLDIEEIDVAGVGFSTSLQDEKLEVGNVTTSRELFQDPRMGKRCISLKHIRGSIFSEASAFQELSRVIDRDPTSSAQGSPVHSWKGKVGNSPTITRTNTRASNVVPERRDTHNMYSSSQGVLPTMKLGESLDDSQLFQSQIFPTNSTSTGSIHSSTGTMRENEGDEDRRAYESWHADRLQDSTRFLPEDIDTDPRDLDNISQRSKTSTDVASTKEEQRPMTPIVRVPGSFETSSPDSGEKVKDVDGNARVEQDPTLQQDDMAESMLFSHEEAQSIYLSAIGEDFTSSLNTSRLQTIGPQNSEYLSSGAQNYTTSEVSDESTYLENNQAPLERLHATHVSQDRESSRITPERATFETSATSSTRTGDALKKDIFLVDLVRIFLPGRRSEEPSAESTAMNSEQFPQQMTSSRPSAHFDMPGAFSLYAESKSSSRPGSSSGQQASSQNIGTSMKEIPQPTAVQRDTNVLELILSSVKVQIDLSLGRLLVQLQKKLNSLVSSLLARDQENTVKAESQGPHHALKVHVDLVSCAYCEQVEARTVPDPAVFSSLHSGGRTDSDETASFTVRLSDLDSFLKNSQSDVDAKLSLGKFTFGFPKDDIISFSKEASIRTSVRDLQEVQERDIRVTYQRRNSSSEAQISTLPLKISVNFQKIDDALNNLGGFSTLFELGSSFASESTTVPEHSQENYRQRTVRFEVSSKPAQATTSSRFRLNTRIGGASVVLQGKESSIKCQSSAIKVVARDTLFGGQIDDIRVTGPVLHEDTLHPKVILRIRNTSLRYLFAPEEHDLTRLISLLTPSRDKFHEDDDFLVDTLIRQRRKGAVMRLAFAKVDVDVEGFEAIQALSNFGDEVSKLSSLTKYLPEESRPGVLTLGLVEDLRMKVQTGNGLGWITADLHNVEVAHIGLPQLIALSVNNMSVDLEDSTSLIQQLVPQEDHQHSPMFMARMIGDDMEPTFKFKLWNVCFEYSVPVIMSIMGLSGELDQDEFAAELATSVLNLGRRDSDKGSVATGPDSGKPSMSSKTLRLDFSLRDCAIGLSPHNLPSKALFVLTDSHITTLMPDKSGYSVDFELRKASMLLIDDISRLKDVDCLRHSKEQAPKIHHHVSELCQLGFVSVCSISAASAIVKFAKVKDYLEDTLDIEFRDELFFLETCADSTQTLVDTLNGLKPPLPPSKGQKYRTEVAPIQDMMASFTGDTYAIGARREAFTYEGAQSLEDMRNSEEGDEFVEDEVEVDDFDNFEDDYSDESQDPERDDIEDFGLIPPGSLNLVQDRPAVQSNNDGISGQFVLKSMPAQVQGTANKWNSMTNRYIPVSKTELAKCPLRVNIKDVHFIWNLHDGYDWEQTRDTIGKAVQDVEARAEEKRASKRVGVSEEEEDESVIGDFLFNSIYIGVPVNHDPKDLSRQINRNIDDMMSETGSAASTSNNSRPSTVNRGTKTTGKKLKLERSKRHKVAFELRGVSADIFMFHAGEETQSSIDIRVQDLEVFDHVPTSTWKKFATYLRDAGPREERKPMAHVEICNVRPVPELLATESVIRVTVLPLRLHVDQDALDFITRFFEFKDQSRGPPSTPAEEPYLQRVEVRPIPVKLDYKPKKVDYAGLRSGRTTEFMNFFILDGADFVLKHAIVYGCSGFLKLHKSLEDIWMPDVRRNQLPSVLSGLNGVRTLVNVGTGVRDLVVVPVREYQKDGRIVRSISKGAVAFAKSTGSELTRFGAKLAVGAQTALQGAEEFFIKPSTQSDTGWEVADLDAEERRAVSNYADQPAGILQGLKGAARSLERDLLVAKDAIIAVSGEVRESDSAEGAAKAVARHAPTLILRPMIGASRAISQTLMGVTNTVDPNNRRRMEDKYKRY